MAIGKDDFEGVGADGFEAGDGNIFLTDRGDTALAEMAFDLGAGAFYAEGVGGELVGVVGVGERERAFIGAEIEGGGLHGVNGPWNRRLG